MYAGVLHQPSTLHLVDILSANVMAFTPAQSTLQTIEYDCCHRYPQKERAAYAASNKTQTLRANHLLGKKLDSSKAVLAFK